jgi:hypothetical protein
VKCVEEYGGVEGGVASEGVGTRAKEGKEDSREERRRIFGRGM